MKYITNETISHFKKFMAKLYKKEEETYLNKKKKREEVKQKNKNEKIRVNNRNGINQYNNYYQGLYIPPMQPINNQNVPIDYQYCYFNNPYPFPPAQIYGLPAYYQQYLMGPPKSLEESLNNIYQRGIVNNIIGAFYIKEQQEKRKNNEKRKVPIATVELGDEQGNNNTCNNANENTFQHKNGESGKSSFTNEKNNKNFSKENNEVDKEEYNENDSDNEDKQSGYDEKEAKKESDRQNNINHENELKKPDIIY